MILEEFTSWNFQGMTRMSMGLNQISRIKILIIFGVFLLSLSGSFPAEAGVFSQEEEQHDCHSIDDLSRGNIREFKDNYIPKEYHPMPEFMIFVDLGILVLLLQTGLFLVVKKKSQQALSIMSIITFAYLGFIRGGCVCPVGAISNVTMGLISPDQIGLASLIIFLVPMIIALVAGRVFCTSGCPLGAIQHIIQKSKNTIKIPARLNTVLKIFPILMLIGTIYYATQSSCFLVCQIEPYKVLFFTGQSWFEQGLAYIMGQAMESKILIAFGIGMWLYLLGILLLGYWIPRPFCRFLCPYGVLLGAISIFSFKPRSIKNNSCVHCGQCQKVCPTQAITIDRGAKYTHLSNYDCVQCNKCNNTCKKNAI